MSQVISQAGHQNILDPKSRFHPHPQVVFQRLGTEAVLVHLTSDRIFELNGTATRIWELLEAGMDLAHIQQRLLAEYDIEAERLNQETANLLAMLLAEELVIAL